VLEVRKKEGANKLRGKERPRRKERPSRAPDAKRPQLDLEKPQKSLEERAIGCMNGAAYEQAV